MTDITSVIEEGTKAKRLLESEFFTQVVEEIHLEIYNGFINSAYDEMEVREDAWYMITALERIKKHIERKAKNADTQEKLLSTRLNRGRK